MGESKTMTYFMQDGTPAGIVKCTLDNWSGLIYKIPRKQLNNDSVKKIKYLQQHAVYLLFEENADCEKPRAYVGKVSSRRSGNGPLLRFKEHRGRDWWSTVILFTTSDNTFNSTEISYLEYALYQKLRATGKYLLQNVQEPNAGNISEEKFSELEKYMNYSEFILGALGFNLSNVDSSHSAGSTRPKKKNKNSSPPKPTSEILYLKNKQGDNAKCVVTPDGYTVLAGSVIRSYTSKHCPKSGIESRKKYARYIDKKTYQTKKDITFKSPSAAGFFVTGRSCNGRDDWKNSEGKSLGQLQEEKRI